MRTHALALAATAAALTTTAAPLPAAAQGMGLDRVFSCSGNRGTTGAVVGGLAGALAGAKVAKNDTLGAVVGAGLGAWAGNQIACRMNDQGRDRAETAFQRALDTGRAQSWSDPRTGATGRVEVLSSGYDSRHAAYAGEYSRPVSATDLRFAPGVQRVRTGLQAAAPMYVANARVNMRAAPNTAAPVVERLSSGQQVRVAGMTRDGWLAIENDGWVQGYVAASTMRPLPAVSYVRNMDSSYDCRLVQQTVSMRGYRTETQRFNACRDTGGEWRIEPI
ncbi:SH3 domain-containing protein [Phenylobacterium sp.]|jgi:surface antigen|uniref:SH3 domain-containing protein n=1 Tax=Phenylobacterium sp. TaxID=1871053 RepID=UPI002F9454B6